ncbi:hypothetical protein SH668x_002331 [Planctomicrobium sp. SH668]|uniref:hypothetical protein n=1 Tax=Planctomicrobium sp. SH668 TaxID=3448126 RepID=UPI003F5B223A
MKTLVGKAQAALLVSLCVAMTGALGCTGGDQGPKLHEVVGKVTVDGKPLELGVITFDPLDGVSGSYGETIKNGEFQLKSSAGKKKVSIMASRLSSKPGPGGLPHQEQYLPAKYNMKSELVREVIADKNSPMTFDLVTK